MASMLTKSELTYSHFAKNRKQQSSTQNSNEKKVQKMAPMQANNVNFEVRLIKTKISRTDRFTVDNI